MKLYILGNGFDIAHKLPTKYCQFRGWLINTYNIDVDEDIGTPSYETNYKGLESYSPDEFASFFVHLLDDVDYNTENRLVCKNTNCMYYEQVCEDGHKDKWCNFEEDLAKLRWEIILQSVEKVYDKEGDLHYFHTEDNMSAMAQLCNESNHILRYLFRDWILYINELVELGKTATKPSFKRIFENGDKYLSFNYTNTLEKLYNINDVCHIHGDISKWQELIFGHSNPGYTHNECEPYEDSAYSIFERIYEQYVKNPIKQIERYKEFFDSIQNVEEIYFYGLSFGDVDLPYFSYIFENCTKIKGVYLYVYNPDEFDEKVAKLKRCGAKCQINRWICK